MSDDGFKGRVEASAILTIIGIVILFSTAVIVTLIAPEFVDPTWVQPTSSYQVQMYEVSDPNIYISGAKDGSSSLQAVYHLKENYSLLAFKETQIVRIIASPELEKFITRYGDNTLKLTSQLLLLRDPQKTDSFDAIEAAEKRRQELREEWERKNPEWQEQGFPRPDFSVKELYALEGTDAFAVAPTDGIVENWADQDYEILDETPKQLYHQDQGVIYILNPHEYRVSYFKFGDLIGWRFDPQGETVKGLETLRQPPFDFRSRKELIEEGLDLFAAQGCWYCHTDQTRTLIQDVVLNGSDSYPAPPSSANEYIYGRITFPGTRRIGPDLSRVGIKRPNRDWHISHFWSPSSESKGSIMPSFKHFFDDDPSGIIRTPYGIPNRKFEAIFQYLMTKGTRITPPNEAWWLGKDPIKTLEIIEGR